jgi:ELWxxDGT repeat protein
MNKKYGVIFCLLMANCFVKAQTFTEFDINPYLGQGSYPTDLVVCNGKLYCSATDSTHGFEPWVSDGTAGGTQLLADIFTGTENSFPQNLTADSNILFFQANDSIHGQELWATNGDSTYLVKDIYPGTGASLPQNLFVFNHKLYFQADDGTHGPELWVSDGTQAGTQLLKDINTANGDTAGSFPSGFTPYNGKLYFNANDNVHGYELWVTDGTTNGTTLVMDIYPDTVGSNPTDLTVCNGKLFFNANDGTDGSELWVTDGTPNGTQLVKDIFPGYQSSNPQGLTAFNNELFFQADDGVDGPELWKSDGTSNGTQLVNDIYSGPIGSYPQGFTTYQGKLFFQATDSLYGAELWVTDGTNSGTTLFGDLNPGVNSSNPGFFIPYHNDLYFIAQPDSVSGAQMFLTDGTQSGTHAIILVNGPLNPLGATNGFTLFDNSLAFSAFYDPNAGQQLWLFNDAPSAIKQVAAKGAFTIYPNPCKDYFTLGGLNPGESYTIRFIDLTGRVLQTQQIEATAPAMQFFTPQISAGVYLVEAQSGQNTNTLRLVKGE